MAKTATKAKPKDPTEIVIKYDLFELPTAFHKAGLAGFVMLIESLKARHELGAEEARYSLTATTASIIFTASLLQKVMDDLYHAVPAQAKVKSKWAGADLKGEEVTEEEVDGKNVKTKWYVYDVVQPSGRMLRDLYPDGDGLWLKLWRDMLWNIPRGRPTTREPYNERAQGKPCKEGPNAWADLLKVDKARLANSFHTSGLSSALLPGTQAANAENVPFEGRAEQNLLLHFWPLAVLLFVPQAVARDGETEFSGYTISVPEVSNISEFVQEYPILLHGLNEGLNPAQATRGYRPARAVIDLPAEGALAFLHHLSRLITSKRQLTDLRFSISGVEYLQLVKIGNNVKTAAAGRIVPDKDVLRGYEQIVSPTDEATRFRNPVFRRGLLTALLEGIPWYRSLAHALAVFDVEYLLRRSKHIEDADSKAPPQFATDARKKFNQEARMLSKIKEIEGTMPDPAPTKQRGPISVIVNRVVRGYILTRTWERTGLNPDHYKTPDGDTDYAKLPSEFNETKQKLAQSLFLEFRSRKHQAFVDHFAATFFSTTQRLTESDREELANALVGPNDDSRDDLKTLTLLSLSANS